MGSLCRDGLRGRRVGDAGFEIVGVLINSYSARSCINVSFVLFDEKQMPLGT
jgi:hypothetical protein